MHPARWLETAFGSESRVRILRHLTKHPGKGWTEREIADQIGMSPNAVNRAVRALREAGLLEVQKFGNAHAVKLNSSPRLLDSLRTVFGTEQSLWGEIVTSIESALGDDSVCYLYGSSARGSPRGGSDIDLLVVATDRETASEVAYAIEAKVHSKAPARLHIIAVDAQEARKRLRRKESVVRAAIEEGRRLGSVRLDEVVRA